MFAAAAVAAAAALTAISTTQTCDQNQLISAGKNGNIRRDRSTTLTWSQYAAQRRSSLQRRKIEINKRLQKTQNNANNPNSSAIAKSKNNIQKEIEQLKLTTPATRQQAALNRSTVPKSTLSQSFNDIKKNDFVRHLPSIIANSNREHIEEEVWFQDLSAKVCNEFIKMHEIHTDITKNDIDTNLNAALTNPTYKNFDMIGDMMNQNMIQESSEFFANTDSSEINKLLLDYIQSHGDELTNEKDFLGQMVSNLNNETVPKLPRPITAKQQKIIKAYEEKVHYRWDPRWLRMFRKRFCIPVAIITLFFLLFTNASSNWIYVNDNERAGLWFYCNITNNHRMDTSAISSSTMITTTTTTSRALYDSNEFNNNNNNSSTIIAKIKKNIFIHEKSFKKERCYATFFFKDNHLAILCLALVGLIFHIIGFVLLIIGMFFSTSNRTLYFYHSAGECLVTSALINGLDLIVFAAVVSSQAKSQPEKTFEFGYCFYVNVVVIMLTFIFSSIFYLDDIVNEYSVWKIKTEERNKRKAAMFTKPKPTLR